MKEEGMTSGAPRRQPLRSFRDLDVYQRARGMNVGLHELVLTLPDIEKYGLVDQIRRASKSIVANIAEGWAVRESAKDFKRYLRMALGSANEIEAHLEMANDLGYITIDVANAYIEEAQVIARQLNRLMVAWRSYNK